MQDPVEVHIDNFTRIPGEFRVEEVESEFQELHRGAHTWTLYRESTLDQIPSSQPKWANSDNSNA